VTGPSFDDPANRNDYVTGLPRSREQHAPNAVHFGPDGWLYVTIGSDTNYGAPSTPFGQLPERYLTAGVLRFNVNGDAAAFPIDVRDVTGPSGQLPNVGRAMFSQKLPTVTGTYTVRVDQVAKTGTTYDPSANAVTSVTFNVR
jgi:hypothetical protein